MAAGAWAAWAGLAAAGDRGALRRVRARARAPAEHAQPAARARSRGVAAERSERRARASRRAGEDLRFDLEIDFKTAVFGGERSIRINHLETCDTCSGSGIKPGASVTTCNTCGGSGVTVQVVSTILGRMQQQSTCPACGGTGQEVEAYCGSCDGRGVVNKAKTLKVNIPKGVDSGQRLRVRNEGNAAPKGGQSGDLYVFITVQEDKQFRREGVDIYTELTVSYIDAILGRRVKTPTIDGEVEVDLPAGTQPGTTLRIEGKGVPKLNSPDVRGNQYIKVIVEIPKKLSKQVRARARVPARLRAHPPPCLTREAPLPLPRAPPARTIARRSAKPCSSSTSSQKAPPGDRLVLTRTHRGSGVRWRTGSSAPCGVPHCTPERPSGH